MSESRLETLVLATITEHTAIRYLACRDGDVEFTIGGPNDGLNLLATAPGLRKLIAAGTAALHDLEQQHVVAQL